jgi:hypothetical protein
MEYILWEVIKLAKGLKCSHFLGPTLSIFGLQIGPKLLNKWKNIGPKGCKLASQIWWYPFFQPWGQYKAINLV